MKMKYLLIFILAVAYLTSGQGHQIEEVRITFRVDVSDILGDIEDVSTLGITGNLDPLKRRRVIPMQAEGDWDALSIGKKILDPITTG